LTAVALDRYSLGMPTPSKRPSPPPSDASTDDPSAARGGAPANLVPGIKPSQERGTDGKIRKKQPVLSAEVVDDLVAMKHVWSNPAASDQTHQQVSFRAMKEANPVGFFDRMKGLEETQPTYTGAGPCPTCKLIPGSAREDEFPEDMGDDRVGELLKDEVDLVEEYFKYRTEFKAWLGQTKGAKV
jgi:hypothetical protein